MDKDLNPSNVNNKKVLTSQRVKQLIDNVRDFIAKHKAEIGVIANIGSTTGFGILGAGLGTGRLELVIPAFIIGMASNMIQLSYMTNSNESKKEGVATSAYQQLSEQTGLSVDELDKMVKQSIAEKNLVGKQKPVQAEKPREI